MSRIPLLGGAYKARSPIAGAERCVNLYPEVNPPETRPPVPVTHYLTPGLTTRASGIANGTNPGATGFRINGLYTASNGHLYGVVGRNVYAIDAAFSVSFVGQIGASATAISMTDNGIEIMLLDDTASGYTINLGTNAFAQIVDPAFPGGQHCDYLDTFIVWSQAGTRNFYSTLSDQITPLDPTYVAAKTGGADLLVGLMCLNRNIWLIGTQTAEVWADTGGAQFPFEELPGTFKDHGCAAAYSIARADTSIFWLGRDRQGQGIVLEANQGYEVNRVSTHAIEYEFSTYSDISDAIGFTYQQAGHAFYFLTFPTADKTWVYDKATKLWHERAWMDGSGVLHRHRANAIAAAYGRVFVGDWQSGTLYTFDLGVFTDAGSAIKRIRSFPHLMNDGKRMVHNRFAADFAPTSAAVSVNLSWSDDRGVTFGNAVSQNIGPSGLTQAQWSRLGLARDRVYQLDWSGAYDTALNGAFLEATPCRT